MIIQAAVSNKAGAAPAKEISTGSSTSEERGDFRLDVDEKSDKLSPPSEMQSYESVEATALPLPIDITTDDTSAEKPDASKEEQKPADGSETFGNKSLPDVLPVVISIPEPAVLVQLNRSGTILENRSWLTRDQQESGKRDVVMVQSGDAAATSRLRSSLLQTHVLSTSTAESPAVTRRVETASLLNVVSQQAIRGYQPETRVQSNSDTQSNTDVQQDSLITRATSMAPGLQKPLEYQWAPVKLSDPMAQWGQQMVDALKDKIEFQVNQSVKQAHIRLDPPDLGRLELNVRMEGDRLSVQLNVSNPVIRESLIQSMEKLRTALMPHHPGGVDVNVGGQGHGSGEHQGRNDQDRILSAKVGEVSSSEETPNLHGWLNTLV
jgi:flagellar hook-length control protein FliK